MARRRQGGAPYSKQKLFLLRLGVLLLAAAAVLTFLDWRLRPVVEDMAAQQARIAAMRSINDAMAETVGPGGLAYNDIVAVTRTADGAISDIRANTALINTLKVRVTERIMDKTAREDSMTLTVPVGTLTGIQFASGRGPGVEIRVVPSGYVTTRVHSQFTSAGINQTVHRIMLEASIQMIVIIPGFTVRTESVTNYCIAETVIVGATPEGYAGIQLDSAPTLSKIDGTAAFG